MFSPCVPFYCEHNDQQVKDELGTGICIGVVVLSNGAIKNLVLWDGVRAVSPAPHDPAELTWLSLVEKSEETTTESIIEGLEDGDFTVDEILEAIEQFKASVNDGELSPS